MRASYAPPASRTTTRLPARANADATTPPPAPLPITTTSALTRSPSRATARGSSSTRSMSVLTWAGIADARPGRVLVPALAFGVCEKERQPFQRRKASPQPFDRRIRKNGEQGRARRVAGLHRKPQQVEQLLQFGTTPWCQAVDCASGVLRDPFDTRVCRHERRNDVT